jgi:hypothetical protein
MIGAIFGIVTIALVGSLTVPVLMLTLARFGYFEPIRFRALGRDWNFAPRAAAAQGFTSASILMFPTQSAAFSAVAVAAYTVAPPPGISDGVSRHETASKASGHVSDVRKLA